MDGQKISPGQLFSLIFLFNMGTALVVNLGIDAEKDAWLTVALGTVGGLFIFFVYTSLFRLFPNLSLISYMKEILGKWIAWPLGLLYSIFFIYGAARDVRDGGDLLVSAILDQTPVIVINAIMVMSVAYVLNKGMEVLARMSLIFMAILLMLGVVSILFLLFSGLIELDRLLPVLGSGWMPVIKTTLNQTIPFPHFEVVCFTMLLPYLNQQKIGIRAGFAAVLISGTILTFTTILNIAVLSTEIAGRAAFPLLQTISLINIGEFIQRLDVIVVLTLIIGVFFKVAIFFYVGVMAAANLFQVQDHRKLIFPVGLIILVLSIIIAGNFPEHIEEGNFSLQTIFVLFGAVIPITLLLVGKVRRQFGSRR